jgi:hypothetical protein
VGADDRASEAAGGRVERYPHVVDVKAVIPGTVVLRH